MVKYISGCMLLSQLEEYEHEVGADVIIIIS
jgi:hypothetical protein